jgi:hypothetical protein
MFIYQAILAFNIWHGVRPIVNDEVIKFFRLMIKIGILGEIGSGKSYVAINFGYPVLMQIMKSLNYIRKIKKYLIY